MKVIFLCFISIISLTFFCCSDNTETPPIDQDPSGKLVIKSTPSGAHIYLNGTNTTRITPDSISNLEPGLYNGFLYLQYYDTTYFSAEVFDRTTTLIDTTLDDAIPFVEFIFDYQMSYGGDSVRFTFTLNQDITMDSIVIQRPIDLSGVNVTDKYVYSAELFQYREQTGNLIKYYLPPTQSGPQYYPAIQSRNYYFSMFGHKAHGSLAEFRSYYQIVL